MDKWFDCKCLTPIYVLRLEPLIEMAFTLLVIYTTRPRGVLRLTCGGVDNKFWPQAWEFDFNSKVKSPLCPHPARTGGSRA